MSQGLLNSIGRVPRNKILNPDSAIDQRNNGAAVGATSDSYITDRHIVNASVAGKITAQQSSVVLGPTQPTNYSLKITVASSFTPTTETFNKKHKIEGVRMRDLLWGSSSARPMVYTVCGMWPIAGDYSVSFRNGAIDRSYVTKFTVNQANTLETHSIYIPGDTSGVWPTDNTTHTLITLDLGVNASSAAPTLNQWISGSYVKAANTVSFVSQANGSAMYIAWEQYERDMRTDFILPDYDDEMLRCWRYFYRHIASSANNERLSTSGVASGTTNAQVYVKFPRQMRIAPTLTAGNPTNTTVWNGSAATAVSSIPADSIGPDGANLIAITTGLTSGQSVQLTRNVGATPAPYLDFNAEL